MLEMSDWIERHAVVDMLRAAQERGLARSSEAIGGGVLLRSPELDGFCLTASSASAAARRSNGTRSRPRSMRTAPWRS